MLFLKSDWFLKYTYFINFLLISDMENLKETKNKIIEFESEIIPCLADSNLYLNKFFFSTFFYAWNTQNYWRNNLKN